MTGACHFVDTKWHGRETGHSEVLVGRGTPRHSRLGLIQREVPATEREPEHSRHSRYTVADPYLRFYYRFLEPHLTNIVRGANNVVWKTIERHWRAFVGTYTFKELCREWVEWVYTAAETEPG